MGILTDRVRKTYKKFILSYVLVLILPISLFTFLFLKNYRDIYREKIIEQEMTLLQTTARELERNIEELQAIAINSSLLSIMDDDYIRKDILADDLVSLLNSEAITHVYLEDIFYYNAARPETVYSRKGTYSVKYYAKLYAGIESEQQFLKQLREFQDNGFIFLNQVEGNADKDSLPLQYVFKTGSEEWWFFAFSQDILDEIFRKENAVTVLQDAEGVQLYPGKTEYVSGESHETIESDSEYYEITASLNPGDLVLLRKIEKESMFEEVSRWQYKFILIDILVLLAGGVLTIILTFYSGKPVKNMEEQIAMMTEAQERNGLLLRLIYGKYGNTNDFLLEMKANGLFEHAQVYRVLVLAGGETYKVGNKLELYLNMDTKPEYEFRVVDIYNRNAAVIIVGMTETADLKLEEVLLYISGAYERNTGERICFYVGNKYSDLENIQMSYHEAYAYSQKSNKEIWNQVIYCDKLEKNDEKSLYPNLELDTLYESLLENDVDKVTIITEVLIDTLKAHSEDRFIRASLYYDVLNTYYRARRELEIGVEAEFMNINLRELRENYDTDHMLECIREQLRSFTAGVREDDENSKRDSHLVSNVIAFIEESSTIFDFSISMIADHFNTSVSNLSHQFKDQTNRTLSDYITEKKFAYAGKLLRESEYSIQEIAAMTGYSQTGSFYRKFKKYYGMTPMEYRSGQTEEK